MKLKQEIIEVIRTDVKLQGEICALLGKSIETLKRWTTPNKGNNEKHINKLNDINVLNVISKHLNKSIDEITE